jgi:small subunit ribosomal protein S17
MTMSVVALLHRRLGGALGLHASSRLSTSTASSPTSVVATRLFARVPPPVILADDVVASAPRPTSTHHRHSSSASLPTSTVVNFRCDHRVSSSSSSSIRALSASADRTKLYVTNLPPDATYASLREIFASRGANVIDCFVSNGGYAFVTVPTVEARGLCNADGGDAGGMDMGGMTLRVDVALTKSDRDVGGRGKNKGRNDDDDGGPVSSSSVAFSPPSPNADDVAADLKKMSLGQLADMRTIPGWDLVHNPPRRNPRGALVGTVVSDKMQRTVNVAVDRYRIVPKYRKRWKFTRKFMAHDENEVCNEGDLVMIVPCQKISRHKHFMVREIIRRKGQL